MKYGRKFIGWMIVSALAASTLAGCSDSGAGGVQSGTPNVVTVTTQPLSSESSSTSGTTAGTSSSDATVTSTSTSSQSAVKIGALVGEGSDVFKHWHGGIIGKRPASGVVTDLKISNEDYTYIRDLGQSIGLQPVYRIPQINLKSDAARAFNEYIKKRAEIDLSGVARQIKGSEQGLRNDNIKGLIYMDYAVNETPRYISIVLYKLNNMTPQNPWMRVDAFVYDKNSSKVLKLSDLLDDFGVAHTDGIAALEALYPKHNIELKKGDSGYTYMQEYAFYLQRLWGVFYDMNSNHGVRGYEEYFDIEGFDWSFYAPLALYVAHEDGKDVLRLIHRDARITGVDDSTGNISYERKILDESFEAIRSGERKVNKVFAAYAGDPPEEVLGIVAYLGSEANRDTAAKFAALYEVDPDLGISLLSTGRNKAAMYVLIPRYEGSVMRISDRTGRTIAMYSAPAGLIFGDEPAPIEIALTSREEWTMFNFPLNPADLDLSEGRILDVTERVRPIEHEKLDAFLELVKYRFR